ncbi:MAG: hypothetical protein ABIH34_05715, partial [Nanoarchaeota archaeon]
MAAPILAVLLLAIVLLSVFQNQDMKSSLKDFLKESKDMFKTPEEPLPEDEFTTEEQKVIDSVNGLVYTINSLAQDNIVTEFSSETFDPDTIGFDSYEIIMHADVKRPGTFLDTCDGYSHTKKGLEFNSKKIRVPNIPVVDNWIWADIQKPC